MIQRFFFLLGACCLMALGAGKTPLRAGAARVDITPAANAALPMSGYRGRTKGFEKIHDNIYVRALVLDNGTTRAALVTWELIWVPNVLWAEVSPKIAAETGVPVENLILAGVHDHDAPSLRGGFGETGPDTAAYSEKVMAATVEAVRQARAKLRPARVGAGNGKAYLNINRRELTPSTNSWWLGRNPDGPSDKTVSVLKFEDMSGKPIAFFINYAVHAVIMGPDNYQISGDLPGATSRFVERYYAGELPKPRSDAGYLLRPRPETTADGVVALWTSGAAGDQNPIMLAPGSDFTLVDAAGQMLGEEVIRVAGAIRMSPDVRIEGAQTVITCPGSRLEQGPRDRKEYKFEDSDPVSIRLSLLMINDIALAGVSGEVLTMINERLKKESPFRNTIMVTNANGSSGYIPDDAAYDQVSYEISTTRFKRGCAENAIVNGLVDLMNRY